jgi:hypothetical protein
MGQTFLSFLKSSECQPRALFSNGVLPHQDVANHSHSAITMTESRRWKPVLTSLCLLPVSSYSSSCLELIGHNRDMIFGDLK